CSQNVLLLHLAERQTSSRGITLARLLLRLAIVERQHVHVDGLFVREHHRLLDAVFKLPYVTGPRVGRQELQRPRGNGGNWPAVDAAETVEEVPHQLRDVVAPLAERR